jgi:hypothetical protein
MTLTLTTPASDLSKISVRDRSLLVRIGVCSPTVVAECPLETITSGGKMVAGWIIKKVNTINTTVAPKNPPTIIPDFSKR